MQNPVSRPNFFIVGAPKCGTTSMHAYLSQHPEIYMAEKEIQYFASDIIEPWQHEVNPEEKYLSYFTSGKNEKIIGDASVWYLYSRQAASKINEFCNNAKILIMLRNPADMLYSYYNFFHRLGKEDIDKFEDALDAEQERREGKRIPKWLQNEEIGEYFPPEGLFYSDVASYTIQVKRYLDIFGKDNIKIILFDNFTNATLQTYEETLSFLEVDARFQPKVERKNPGLRKQVRFKTLRKLVKNPATLSLAKTLRKSPAKNWTSQLINAWASISQDYVPVPPLNSSLRATLIRAYAKDIQDLSDLINQDLSHWMEI